jgi:ABC-type transporter Mla maintaining outer membrane lipid asymmetry ATPase subunit MlaF
LNAVIVPAAAEPIVPRARPGQPLRRTGRARRLDLECARRDPRRVGGSGTGKSVLMRRSSACARPDAGRDRSIRALDATGQQHRRTHERRNTGVLFQDGALFSSLTVGENVQVP